MNPSDLRILLVDDDDVDRIAIQRAFKRHRLQCPVLAARNGAEALHLLRGEVKAATPIERPFMILLDLNMPTMNGFEFLEELRQDEELKDAVIFVVTTSGDCSDMRRAYQYNIAGYIVKSELGPGMGGVAKLMDQYCQNVRMPA